MINKDHLFLNRNPKPPSTPPFIPPTPSYPYRRSPNLSPPYSSQPKSPIPPPKSPSPIPKSLTPTPPSPTPPPKSLTPQPKSPIPTPPSPTPPPKSPTPPSKSLTPPPHQGKKFASHLANFFFAWARATQPTILEPSASTPTPQPKAIAPSSQLSFSRRSIPGLLLCKHFIPFPHSWSSSLIRLSFSYSASPLRCLNSWTPNRMGFMNFPSATHSKG